MKIRDNQSFSKKADRVGIYALYGCGECHYCKMGLTQFCRSIRGVANSGHAQYTACRDENCIRIADDLPFDSAVLIYGDTLGVAYRAMQNTDIRKGATAYVIGAGPIGLGIMALSAIQRHSHHCRGYFRIQAGYCA